MENILTSISAFYQNAYAHIVYSISNNFWLILIVVSMVGLTIQNLREELAVTVKEEQQAL